MNPFTHLGAIRLNNPRWTPPEWEHVKIVAVDAETFAVRPSASVKFSEPDKTLIGLVVNLEDLTHAEALKLGLKAEKWFEKQERKGRV